MEPIRLGTGFTQARSADLFSIMELCPAQVADRKVRKVQLSDGPLRWESFDLLARDAAAKEGQLVAERAPVLGREVACVVPPFGSKVVVGAMIARELVLVARGGRAKF